MGGEKTATQRHFSGIFRKHHVWRKRKRREGTLNGKIWKSSTRVKEIIFLAEETESEQFYMDFSSARLFSHRGYERGKVQERVGHCQRRGLRAEKRAAYCYDRRRKCWGKAEAVNVHPSGAKLTRNFFRYDERVSPST